MISNTMEHIVQYLQITNKCPFRNKLFTSCICMYNNFPLLKEAWFSMSLPQTSPSTADLCTRQKLSQNTCNIIFQCFKQQHKLYQKESIPKEMRILGQSLKSFLDQLLQFLDTTRLMLWTAHRSTKRGVASCSCTTGYCLGQSWELGPEEIHQIALIIAFQPLFIKRDTISN